MATYSGGVKVQESISVSSTSATGLLYTVPAGKYLVISLAEATSTFAGSSRTLSAVFNSNTLRICSTTDTSGSDVSRELVGQVTLGPLTEIRVSGAGTGSVSFIGTLFTN